MFRSLALGGGGVRAGLQIGALKALEAAQGHLQFPDGLWGCSAGALLATAVAFNLTTSQIESMYVSRMDLGTILPRPRLESFTDLMTKKGFFSMDAYEQAIVDAFDVHGIDLRTKTIADAPQPLHIVASNLTTQNPTVFRKQVRILDALRCSACIPLVFQPQVLYNNVYVDGGVLVDCLDSLVDPDCLVLHISEPVETLYVRDVETMSLPSYVHRIYRSMRGRPSGRNVLWLHNRTTGILQDLTEEEKRALIAEGASQARAFLAKRFAKEHQDVVGSSLSTVVDER